MKPRTKAQKQVDKLFPQLPDNTIEQFMTAQYDCFKHRAIRYRGTCTCSECGKRWQNATDAEETVCPHCGAKLKIEAENKYTFTERTFYQIAMVFHGWQVVRIYYIEKVCKMKSFNCWMDEIGQIWFKGNSEVWVASGKRAFSYYSYCPYLLDGNLSIKPVDRRPYSNNIGRLGKGGIWIDSLIHPLDYCYKYNPERFKKNYIDDMYLLMRKDKLAETLFKRDDSSFDCYIKHRERINGNVSDAFRIALRHNYDVGEDNFSSWIDMVCWLAELGKDIHNSFYVCPKDFNKAHNYWHKVIVKKRETVEEKIRLQENLKHNEEYIKQRKKFFPLVITDGEITIKVLRDIADFYWEYKKMNHCVYTCGYWDMKRHPNSLILSARLCSNSLSWPHSKSIETIEIDLRTFNIVQSRGFDNYDSKYHEQIVKLVKDNMQTIRDYAKGKYEKKKLAVAV